MQHTLLMNAWVAAHLNRARHQALLCSAGSGGEGAFRESLRPQYTSPRHHAKSLCTSYIRGTSAEGTSLSRIVRSNGIDIDEWEVALHFVGDTVWVTNGNCVPRSLVNRYLGARSPILHKMRITMLSLEMECVDCTPEDFLSHFASLVHVDMLFRANTTVQLGSSLLASCAKLTSVSLQPPAAIEEIPWRFLEGCASITTVDLQPLTHIKRIGPHFLCDCSRLVSVDLGPLFRVDRIPPGFLGGCSSLESVCLKPLGRVYEISSHFMRDCHSLTSIDLTPLALIADIPWGFLLACIGLKEIDFTPLKHIKSVGYEFLGNCTGLRSVDLAPLSAIEEAPRAFLHGCRSLVEYDLLTPLSCLTRIGPDFMLGCAKLTGLNLEPLWRLEEIPWGFLQNCHNLVELDLRPLSRVRRVGPSFLRNCRRLASIDVAPLSSIERIPGFFLRGCITLSRAVEGAPTKAMGGVVDLNPLSHIEGYQLENLLAGLSQVDTNFVSPY